MNYKFFLIITLTSLKDLIKIHSLRINKETIHITKKTRLWCQLPYPNHPQGCPNYKKNPLCPPKVKFMKEIIEVFQYFYLIYAIFNLKNQRERMLSIHPEWSNKQANCLLYWQGSVKKELKDYIKRIILLNDNVKIFILSCGSGFKLKNCNQEKIYSMEAVGINVFHTLKNNNIGFEIKPKNKVILTNLLCSNKPLLIQ